MFGHGWSSFSDAPKDGRRVLVGGWLKDPSAPSRKSWFTVTAYYGKFSDQGYSLMKDNENQNKEWIVFGFITLNNFPCEWVAYKEQEKPYSLL